MGFHKRNTKGILILGGIDIRLVMILITMLISLLILGVNLCTIPTIIWSVGSCVDAFWVQK
jgi:hypothetical protein